MAQARRHQRDKVEQYIMLRNAILRDFESEIINNDYIGTDRHLEIYNAVNDLSKVIRRLQDNEQE
jgi:hypothetical protein